MMRAVRAIRPSLVLTPLLLAMLSGFSRPTSVTGSTSPASSAEAPPVPDPHPAAVVSTPASKPTDDDTYAAVTQHILGSLCEAIGSPVNDCPKSPAPAQLSVAAVARAASLRGEVSFLVATVPDYVDSNTAWMADEILGAIQAAMPHAGYVLDRFTLPEIPESGSKPAGDAASGGRHLHESRPGVLIFRGDRSWKVVLITLETATSGLHLSAFENAARFIAEWQGQAGQSRELRIVGPTFSGSVDLMVSSLGRLAADSAVGFTSIHVVSGSATQNDNVDKFAHVCTTGMFSPDNCSYATAMHTNGETVEGLYRFLQRMNPGWLPGRVALLQEANTSFGIGFNATADIDKEVHRYWFPLHIAQLRENSRSAPVLPSLLTPPAVALHLGESVPPTDLVPPMRPDVASPVTDLTMAAILDDIRHRGFAAVGVYATDVRDTLYLSREIKRAAPDIQLFYPSGHLLFQHPDFVAYTRGAIVASTYPLSATYQLWGDKNREKSNSREMFSSTVAEGVFNATLTQAVDDSYLPDYPPQREQTVTTVNGTHARLGPKPALWLAIVGDDGFWPLNRDGANAILPQFVETAWPMTGVVVATLLLAVVLLHGWVMAVRLAASHGLDSRRWGGNAVQRVPILNALLPSPTLPQFASLHRVMSAITFVNVGCLFCWGATVTIVHHFGATHTVALAAVPLVPLLALVGIIAGTYPRVEVLAAREASEADASASGGGASVAGAWLAPLCYAVPLYALIISVGATYWIDSGSGIARFAAARTVGGGIASPAALVISLVAAMQVPVFWTLRRLTTVGKGYGTLVTDSTAFRRLLGSSDSIDSFAALLDSPIRRLPPVYLAGLAAAVAIVAPSVFVNIATVDGVPFSVFVATASLLASVAALALLAQAFELWRRLRGVLTRASELPLCEAIERLGAKRLHWNISVSSPDSRDVRALLGLAGDLRARIALHPDAPLLLGPIGQQALVEVSSDDRTREDALPLARNAAWPQLWRLADALLPVLERYRWTCCDGAAGKVTPLSSEWLDCAETFVAALRALVLRDVTARIMAGVFAAMLCVGLLTVGHLLYVFGGRQSLLSFDSTMLFAGGSAAMWILVGMEKDPILSILWRTTPGRVTFNWAFAHQIFVYGVVPLLIVVGSVFPEVGEKLVLLIEPLRKLTTL